MKLTPLFLSCFSILLFANIVSRDLPAQNQDDVLQDSQTMGPVTASVRLSPAKPVIGDLLILDLEVNAEKDVEVLMPEFGEALSRFQIVDFTPKEEINAQGGIAYRQKYKLQSPPSGPHSIPPILIEFVDRREGETEAPEGMDAYELFTNRIDFEVQSVVVDDAAAGLNPPMGRLEPRGEPDSQGLALWQYMVVIGCALLGVGAFVLGIAFYRNKAIRKTAYEIAKRQLDRLINEPLPSADQMEMFYVELSTIVRKYLENRYDLRAPELTTEEFLIAVSSSAELTADHKELLKDFLRHADLVKFAGVRPSESDVKGMIEKATRFLEETRENSPLLIDPESHPQTHGFQKTGGQQ